MILFLSNFNLNKHLPRQQNTRSNNH